MQYRIHYETSEPFYLEDLKLSIKNEEHKAKESWRKPRSKASKKKRGK